MLSAIDDLERILKENPSVEAANVLGRSLECYTAWYVRGDDRKAFLDRACDSYRHAKNKAIIPLTKRFPSVTIVWYGGYFYVS